MSAELDAIGTGKVCDAVGILPVEFSLTGLSGLRLHVVLSCHAVELLFDQGDLFGIRHIALVHSDTDHEVVLVDVLQSLSVGAGATHYGEQQTD